MTEAVDAEALAQGMPAGFAFLASGGRYEIPPHLELLNEKLLDVAEGRCKRLMISMPPRHGKSETVSKYFPAWVLANYPDKRIILCSYEADFASSWGRKARNILEEYGPEISDVRVAQDSSAANRWDIEGHLGGMVTAGVGGPITGKGADILIIDDPVKNSEEAESATVRDKTWDWYRSTAYTRLEPGGAVILIMTRWHEDDLAGRLLIEEQNGGDKWEKIIFPAEAEEDDALDRKVGEPLWPERFSLARLKEISKTLGSYLYAALFQQRPMPAGTALFRRDRFRYAKRDGSDYILRCKDKERRVPVSACWRFQTCDPSGTSKETSDYFVIMTFDITPANEIIIVGITRVQADSADQEVLLDNDRARFKPGPIYQCLESKSYGLHTFQVMRRKGKPIKELIADTDKVIRARPASVAFENERIFILDGVEEQDAFERELLSFPKGANDDMVDTLSYGVREVEEVTAGGPRMREL